MLQYQNLLMRIYNITLYLKEKQKHYITNQENRWVFFFSAQKESCPNISLSSVERYSSVIYLILINSMQQLTQRNYGVCIRNLNKIFYLILNDNYQRFIIRQFIIHSQQKMYNHYGKYNSYSSVKKIKNYSYNPLQSIGKGFSSVVYKGLNDDNKQPVAIKAIDMRGIRDSAAKQMLDYQIQALSTLKHPNIMKCFDVIRQTSHCYVITELCNGGDLGEALKRKSRYSESEATKLIIDIVKGYIQIGNKGFLHRDLKLANVLLSNGQAKIADFGFAKKCKAPLKQKYNVGSPLYMSPEALKSNLYSMKNDIWSIGIMAYELLHGDTPWPCKTEKELIQKMVKIPVKFKDSLKLSSNIKDFIRKCLQVSETKRMSLEGLKQWISQQQSQSTKENNQNGPAVQPKLIQKPTAIERLQPRPLSQLTNKMNNTQKISKSVNKLKVPHSEIAAVGKEKLSKSIINLNNNSIIKEIIIFRLYFKALQKLKGSSDFPSSAQLKNILGNQTIRRVTLLKKLICSEDTSANQYFSLKNIDSYLNPIYNPDIKKYKSVIGEYFNKYTTQIKMQILEGRQTPSEIISNYLKTLSSSHLDKDNLLAHWLTNLVKVNSGMSKSELQQILEPKNNITTDQIKDKIQLICA